MDVMKSVRFLCACSVALLCIFVLSSLYTSEKEGVLNMKAAVYAQAHSLDPLFAFPGSDISSMEYSLREFLLSAHTAVPQFPEDEGAKDSIYPFRFLTLLPDTEQSRRALLMEPTADAASSYHIQLLSLLDAHSADLRRADELLSKDTNGNIYRFFSGETTVTAVRQVLQAALAANETTKEREERRFSCFEGNFFKCESTALLRLRFGKIYPSRAPVLIPQVAVDNQRALAALYPSATFSPIYALQNSVCVPENPAFYALAIEPSRLSEVPTAQALYLNEIYVEHTPSSTHPFYVLLRKSGAIFTYQPISAYLCPDYGNDIGVVLGMYELSQTLHLKPFAFSGFQTATQREIAETATTFISSSALQESDYHAFLNAAASAVRAENLASLAERLGGRGELLRLMEQVTEAKARSSRFDLVVGYFDDLQIGSYIPYRLNPTPPSVFLITRGGLSQLYALGNETVFPGAHSLLSKDADSEDLFKDSEIPIRVLTQSYIHQAGFSNAMELLNADAEARREAFSGFISELLFIRNR